MLYLHWKEITSYLRMLHNVLISKLWIIREQEIFDLYLTVYRRSNMENISSLESNKSSVNYWFFFLSLSFCILLACMSKLKMMRYKKKKGHVEKGSWLHVLIDKKTWHYTLWNTGNLTTAFVIDGRFRCLWAFYCHHLGTAELINCSSYHKFWIVIFQP